MLNRERPSWVEIDCDTREHIFTTLVRIQPPRLRRVSHIERWPLTQSTWVFVGERDEILVEEFTHGRATTCTHWLTDVGVVRMANVLRQVS